MLSGAFTLVLQLPPLAFGPALPARPFEVPRVLVCPIRDLGRIQEPVRNWPSPLATTLDQKSIKPIPNKHLLNPALEFVLVMSALASTHGGWDDRSWSTKSWQINGAVTPVLIPPQAPPIWSVGQR
jgi:hypothetical protein